MQVPEDCLDGRFLMHQLRALDLRRLDSSTAVPSLRRHDLESQRLVIPPVDEQRRVVDILEDHLSRLNAADEWLGRSRIRAKTLEGAVLDSVIGVGDERCLLGELLSGVEAGRSFGGSAAPAGPGEWGIIKVSAMTWGAFRPEENKAVPETNIDPRFEIRPGDVLVSRANTTAYVGASVLVKSTPSRLLLSDKSLRLILREDVDPEWLVFALTAPRVRRQISARATGTKDSMRNISQAGLRSVEVPVRTSHGRGSSRATPRRQR
jgi:type I restriction enzyme S subunit